MKKYIILILSIMLISVSLPNHQGVSAGKFKDVSSGHWAYDEIIALTDKKIINGHTDGTFRPEDPISRAHAAMLIGRAIDVNTSDRPNPGFADVSKNTTGYDYIAALTEEGIFAKDTKFNPSASLQRDQMAKILVLAFDLSGTADHNFKDVPNSHWAADFIRTLYANEITTGQSKNSYAPAASVTRAEMATFLYRVLSLKDVAPSEPGEDLPTGNTAITNEMLKSINTERKSKGLNPLALDNTVQKVANVKADDMKNNQYFDHYSPTYGSIFHMLDNEDVSRNAAGENIAAGQQTGSGAVTDWMNSEGHRNNILNQNYTHAGIGFAEGGDHGTYYVLVLIGK